MRKLQKNKSGFFWEIRKNAAEMVWTLPTDSDIVLLHILSGLTEQEK